MKVCFALLLLLPLSLLAQSPDSIRCGRSDIRDSFQPDNKRYHNYEVRHLLGDLNTHPQWNARFVFNQLIADKHCAAPADPKMTGPVVPCEPTEVIVAITRHNPVITSVDTAAFRIVNYALPGHFLYPGKVERRIVVEADSVWIVTTSVGYGRLPKIDERKSEKVWGKVDDYLRERLMVVSREE